jgi:hypothetical protein
MLALMYERSRSPWTGPVVRHQVERKPSLHLTWRCPAPLCGRFTMDGAYLKGRCNFCNHPRN